MASRFATLIPKLARNLRPSPSGILRPLDPQRCFSQSNPVPAAVPEKAPVRVTFKMPDGEKITVQGKEGDSLLDVVINKNIPADGYGACEGTLACSTCHVILSKADFDKLPNRPCDEELDMLDLAYGLSDTSRLGCQIVLTKELEGLEVQIPAGVSDARGS